MSFWTPAAMTISVFDKAQDSYPREANRSPNRGALD